MWAHDRRRCVHRRGTSGSHALCMARKRLGAWRLGAWVPRSRLPHPWQPVCNTCCTVGEKGDVMLCPTCQTLVPVAHERCPACGTTLRPVAPAEAATAVEATVALHQSGHHGTMAPPSSAVEPSAGGES